MSNMGLLNKDNNIVNPNRGAHYPPKKNVGGVADSDLKYSVPKSGSAASGLPEVTAADNGKVLKVINGSWAAGEIATEDYYVGQVNRDVYFFRSSEDLDESIPYYTYKIVSEDPVTAAENEG